MKCYTPCFGCSYYEVAKSECDEVTLYYDDADICVDDPVMFLERVQKKKVKCKLWGDSMADPSKYVNLKDVMEFSVASQWNYDYFTRAGFHVKGVERRHIFPVDVSAKRDVLFITVGVSRFFDRKNLSLPREMRVRSSTIIVGNMMKLKALRDGKLVPVDEEYYDYPAFALHKEVLHRLYARAHYYLALSVSEGFGLPPIEASYHGTVPVYVNGHAYRENLVGIPIDVKDEYTVSVDGYHFRVWEPDLRHLKSVIDEIKRGEMKEREADLREKVKQNARRFLSEGLRPRL